MSQNIVVIGGGPAGIEASRRLRDLGYTPILIEKEPFLGGHLARWDRLFPDGVEARTFLEPMLADRLDSDRTPWGFAKDLWHYVSGWICRALVAARDEAARTGSGNPSDYVFTFAAAIVGKLRTGFIQVGDGAIAVRTRTGACDLVFKPEKGRYANVTTFLDAKPVEEDTFLTRVLPTPEIVGIMVMCDGPEVCMIDLASNKPAPIVGQMLEDYSKDEVDRHTVLSYLTGMRWMTDPRGGDDKSIALLACRRANQ